MSVKSLIHGGFVIPRWHADNVFQWDELCLPGGGLNPVTDVLLRLTPLLGVSRITEENVKDVWLRVAVLQVNEGAFLADDSGREIYLTDSDLKRHIGLETEASDKPLADFLRMVMRTEWREPGNLFNLANGGATALEVAGVAPER